MLGDTKTKRTTMFGEKEWKHLQNIYASIYKDILENKNLEKHLKDVEDAIMDLDEIIKKERTGDKPTPALDDVKNDFYFLKYQILERI